MDEKEIDRYISLFRECSETLTPKKTNVEPSLPNDFSWCKAILFDVYGTLFISGSGDIGIAKEETRAEIFSSLLKEVGISLLQPFPTDTPKRFFSVIEKEHIQKKTEGYDYPEVRIEQIWIQFLEDCKRLRLIQRVPSLEIARELSVRFETKINPVWPMPGALDLLIQCRESSIPMGIVSNAQFFTSFLFSSLFGKSLEELGFHNNLLLWSYQEGWAKPSRYLYEKASKVLKEKYTILPNQTLYIGNDMRNDIAPAKQLGFLTALYAGDSRSLRWRREDPDCTSIIPDFIITEFNQIKRLCGHS